MRIGRAALGVLLMSAALCSRRDAPDAGASVATPYSPSAGVGAPAISIPVPRTTDPKIAIANLNAEIADRERRAARGEDRVWPELIGRYLARARFEGRVADLVTADDASARLVAEKPNDAKAHLTRAKVLSGIHEFAAATGELDAAAKLGADPGLVRAERAAVLLAVGRENEAAAMLPVADDARPADLAMRAGIEARIGNAAESERLFDLARSHYTDVTPFVLAWMDFEHARALAAAGDRAHARPYLAEAATILPTYAQAVAHLAAMEPPEQALAQLAMVEKTSDDPELIAAEADALRRAGRRDDAKATATRAAARYAEVLARLPKAYADHAAWFYLGMGGDVQKALVLARENAENRPNAEAMDLLHTAEAAAGVHR